MNLLVVVAAFTVVVLVLLWLARRPLPGLRDAAVLVRAFADVVGAASSRWLGR